MPHILAGAVGWSEAKWRGLVGEVEAFPIVFHPRPNWQIEPSGTDSEREAIEKAAQLVREALPYVTEQVPDGRERSGNLQLPFGIGLTHRITMPIRAEDRWLYPIDWQ